MSALIVRLFDQLDSYHPPHHTGTTNRRLLSAEDTCAEISVVHGTLEHGGGADYHYHEESDQILFVIDGECRVDVNGQLIELAKNDTIVLPRKIPHGVEVLSKTPLQLHITYVPALQSNDVHSVAR